jgi:hypothetical protein
VRIANEVNFAVRPGVEDNNTVDTFPLSMVMTRSASNTLTTGAKAVSPLPLHSSAHVQDNHSQVTSLGIIASGSMPTTQLPSGEG